jgi:hypothetical protein
MLTSRKSVVDIGAVRRAESMASSRRHPVSSRGSMVMHAVAQLKRRHGKHLWRVGTAAVHFLVRIRRSQKLPKLTVEETKEIAAKYFSVLCLNDLTSVNEFIGSLGIHATSETLPSMLAQVKFREGQALTLYQILRLMTFLKRLHLSTTGSDTVEAFTALAIDGRIPTNVFRATMMKFDLRVQVHEPHSTASMNEVDEETADPFQNQDKSTGDRSRGIDIQRFTAMLSDEDDTKTKRDLAKRRFSRLDSVRAASLHVSEAFESASPTEPRTPSVASPKPFDALLSQVRQSLSHNHDVDLFKRDTHAEKSPLRGEVFPFRSNKRRWDFQDVVKRIDEVESMGDVHRPFVSRNARYCSNSERPRFALLTPFTDLHEKKDLRNRDAGAQMNVHRLSRHPPRGLPAELAETSTKQRRSASMPLTERFPILAKRRDRLMYQLPHRNFESNGSVSWALTQAQRAALESSKLARHTAVESDQQDILRHIASATLMTVNNNHK